MTTNFLELCGDRNVKDDKAMVGGFAQLDGQTVHVYWTAERHQYQNKANAKLWHGQPGGLPQSPPVNALPEKFGTTCNYFD
jgi:acetyl-CoA carboxylase carboxyl transferase subunit alpha